MAETIGFDSVLPRGCTVRVQGYAQETYWDENTTLEQAAIKLWRPEERVSPETRKLLENTFRIRVDCTTGITLLFLG